MAASKESCRRRDTDLVKLMMSDHEVHIPDESNRYNFFVKFRGPRETPYDAGIWKVHVTLPGDYPFKSPSIGFSNRMFHPNVDEISGSVCLDVINQTWSPMYDLTNIFDVFLPQLLRYPNPSDPLNGQAAAIMMRDTDAYTQRIKDYIDRYASDDFCFDGDDEMDVEVPQQRARSATMSSASTASSSSSCDADMDTKLPAQSAALADDGNESDVSELSDL